MIKPLVHRWFKCDHFSHSYITNTTNANSCVNDGVFTGTQCQAEVVGWRLQLVKDIGEYRWFCPLHVSNARETRLESMG